MTYWIPAPLAVDGVTLTQNIAGIVSIAPGGVSATELAAGARPTRQDGGTYGVTTASVTRYYSLNGGASLKSSEDSAKSGVAAAETLTRFAVVVLVAIPTNNVTVTVRKNGGATAATVTVPGLSAVGTVVAFVGSISFAQDDVKDVEVVSGATTQCSLAWSALGNSAV